MNKTKNLRTVDAFKTKQPSSKFVLCCTSWTEIGFIIIWLVSLRFFFILILLLDVSLHRSPLAVTVNLEVTSHDNLGGVDIPWWKQTNTTRLASHLDGRARGGNLPICVTLFYLDTWGRKLPTSPDTQIGWDLPMASHKILTRLCKSWPI